MGGESIDAFRRCQKQLEKLVYGGTDHDEIKKKVLNKAYEITIYSFDEDAKSGRQTDSPPLFFSAFQLPRMLERQKGRPTDRKTERLLVFKTKVVQNVNRMSGR